MSKFTEETVAALEQAKKLQALKAEIQRGLDDEAAGRVRPWDFADFLQRAREMNAHR
jgi:predicted transcriptional regulator